MSRLSEDTPRSPALAVLFTVVAMGSLGLGACRPSDESDLTLAEVDAGPSVPDASTSEGECPATPCGKDQVCCDVAQAPCFGTCVLDCRSGAACPDQRECDAATGLCRRAAAGDGGQPPADGGTVGSEPSAVYDLRALATGTAHKPILKLFNPVIDPVGRKMYVVGSKTRTVGVIDLATETLVEVFDIGVLGGYLVFDGSLYSFDFAGNKCHLVDTSAKSASEIDLQECVRRAPNDKGVAKPWGAFTFTETGYRSGAQCGFRPDWRQDLNAAYGVIEIRRPPDAGVVGEIVHGPDALYFTIDQATGRLYTTNTGDGSVSIFDLNQLEATNLCEHNACFVKNIDVGDSVDQLVVGESGTLYVRNRLGGSVLYAYDPSSGSFSTFQNENGSSLKPLGGVAGGFGIWPTGMAVDEGAGKLFVLSHYDASMSVMSLSTRQEVARISFETSLKPRTDGISTFRYDKTNGRLYASWPELGLVAVGDAVSGTAVGTIDLTALGFDMAAAANGGPGVVNLAVDEVANKLLVYWNLNAAGRLVRFDGATLAKEAEAAFQVPGGEDLMVVSHDRGMLYLSNQIVDLETLTATGALAQGGKVRAFDLATDTLYTANLRGNEAVGYTFEVYAIRGGATVKTWSVAGVSSIVTSFVDLGARKLYLADFTTSRVFEYPL